MIKNKKRGSILIYVMMIFAVLMIMSSTLLMLTTQNRMNRKHYAQRRVHYYYTESGIDQAYGVVSEYVQNANNFAAAATDRHVAETAEKDFKLLQQIEEKRKVSENADDLISQLKLYKHDGTIDANKLKLVKQEKFTREFIEYFKATYNSNTNVKNLINDIESDRYYGVGIDKVSMAVLNRDFEVTNSGAVLNLESTFNAGNMERKVRTDIVITIPDINSKLSYPDVYHQLFLTPVMNKALVVNEKMKIDGKVRASGDVYVRGDDSEAVIIQNQKAQLTVVEGSLTAAGGVLYSYNQEYNSSLPDNERAMINVEKNIYTRNILFAHKKDDIYGSQGGKLLSNGGVYVRDDLQIDSEHIYVDINDYYGTYDGSEDVNNTADHSSSIIINARELGVGETQAIFNTVMIPGTAYLKDLDDPTGIVKFSYQTGNSILCKNDSVGLSGDYLNDNQIEAQNKWKRFLKQEAKNTYLAPLGLRTHFALYSRWFTLFDGSDKKFVGDISQDLKDKYPGIAKFRIKGESEEFKLGEVTVISDELYSKLNGPDVNKNSEVEFELIDDSGNLIETLKVYRVDNNIDAFVKKAGNKSFIFVQSTPRGSLNENIRGSFKYLTSEDDNTTQTKSLESFKELRTGITPGSSIDVKLYDRFDQIKHTERVATKDYDQFFKTMTALDKGKAFVKWASDYHGENILEGYKAIRINDISNSLFLGAITLYDDDSSKRVLDQNFYADLGGSQDKVNYRRGILKDKLFFMNNYEMAFRKEADDPFKGPGDKRINIEDLTPDEYSDKIEDKMSLINTSVVTPEDYVHLVAQATVKELKTKGIYISTSDQGALLTNKNNNSGFAGDVIKVNDEDRGIIVVKNDLTIKGDFEFNGLIVVMGNLTVHKDAQVKLFYDSSVVKNAAVGDLELVKKVFKDHPKYSGELCIVKKYNEKPQGNTVNPVEIQKWVVVK